VESGDGGRGEGQLVSISASPSSASSHKAHRRISNQIIWRIPYFTEPFARCKSKNRRITQPCSKVCRCSTNMQNLGVAIRNPHCWWPALLVPQDATWNWSTPSCHARQTLTLKCLLSSPWAAKRLCWRWGHEFEFTFDLRAVAFSWWRR